MRYGLSSIFFDHPSCWRKMQPKRCIDTRWQLTGLTGGGDLVRGLVLLTGCVIGAACWPARCAAARGVAVGATRRPASGAPMDARSGSDVAGYIRDDGPARLADAAPEINIIIISINVCGVPLSPLIVCLFLPTKVREYVFTGVGSCVCLWPRKIKKSWTDLYQILWEGS